MWSKRSEIFLIQFAYLNVIFSSAIEANIVVAVNGIVTVLKCSSLHCNMFVQIIESHHGDAA